jgi:hypothetical protein
MSMVETSHPGPPGATTVEAVVRRQLARALGGARGMVEAAVPTIAFTVLFLTTHNLNLAVLVSVAVAAVLLVVRLLHRSSVKFVVNSLVGIGIGALFAWRAARHGGSAGDQALAYFLPGLLYNAVYAVLLVVSIVVRWPLVGFIVGSVTGDPTEWHRDARVVRLCSRLTWLLAAPCLIRVVVQGPIYLAGRNGWWDQDSAVAALAASKLVMGWPLQIAALATMAWLLSRNNTPMEQPPAVPPAPPAPPASL